MDSDISIPITTTCSKCGKIISMNAEADLDVEMEVKIEGKRGWYRRETVQPLKPLSRIVLCNSCADQKIAARNDLAVTSRMQEWRALCPASYRDTVPARLPSPARLEVVMRWKYGAKGLTLVGTTGRGKSRCAWKLIEREFFNRRSAESIDSKFSMEYSSKIGISGTAAYEWLEKKMQADILLLDDVFKVRLENSGAETALFAIIEERMANNRPMIITTQDTGETLKSRMSVDRGEATVRRLRECCETITF